MRRRLLVVPLLLALLAPAARATAPEPAGDAPRSGWLFVLPVLMYSPETEFGFGASGGRWLQFGDAATTRRSTVIPALIYTTKNQVISVLAGDAWWADDAWHAEGLLGYSDFPTDFFGTGNAVRDADEETYTSRTLTVDLSAKRRFGAAFYAGPRVYVEDLGVHGVEPGGLIAAGDLPGSDGGLLAALGWDLAWDTRDAQHYPTRGSYHELRLLRMDDAFGADWDMTELSLHLRRYLPLGGRRVLALHLALRMQDGEVPFQRLSALTLRGYYDGRYRDRQAAACEVEYRAPLTGRLGWVVFAGAGRVAREIDELRLRDLHPAAGVGLRVGLSDEETVNLRFDQGFGRGDGGFYVQFAEAF